MEILTLPRCLTIKAILLALKQSGNFINADAKTLHLCQNDSVYELITDSRHAHEQAVFIAIKGTQIDSHDFLPEVHKLGTQICIVEQTGDKSFPSPQMATIQVRSSRRAWATLCAEACGNPQKKLTLIGVTGTNGKTSVVWMLRQLMLLHNIPCVSIGTLGVYFPRKHYESHHTTPDPNKLFPILKAALDEGITYVFMEVSSHSVVQERCAGLEFSVAIFTSFSRDHLDFHPTVEDYFAAKLKLFSEYSKSSSLFILNTGLGDRLELLPEHENCLYYGYNPSRKLGKKPQAQIHLISHDVGQSEFLLKLACQSTSAEYSFKVPYFSIHALENFTGAWLAFKHLTGITSQHDRYMMLEPVPGRLEIILGPDEAPLTCIIDYAHTPDALEKTLLLLKSLSHRKIAVVFGCGGNRDSGKRPIMGAIAANHSDLVIVTSDNPRNEDPDSIINEILLGIPQNLSQKTLLEPDRSKAIAKAITWAYSQKPHSHVLIAGKGHESYQIIGHTKIPFKDQDQARHALLRLKNGGQPNGMD